MGMFLFMLGIGGRESPFVFREEAANSDN